MEKKEKLKKLIQDLHQGRNEEEVKEEFKKEFGKVSSSEISQLEQDLIGEGTSPEEIQKLCNVHAAVFTGNIEDLDSLDAVDREFGHPLFVFRKENVGLSNYIEEKIKPAMKNYENNQTEDNEINLKAEFKSLYKLDRHYSRKENLFFPFLEKAGITGPPQVMWGKDDEIRALIKETFNGQLKGKELLDKAKEALEEVEGMISKENDILSPLLLNNIKSGEWLAIALGSETIGYAFNGAIEGASPSDANQWVIDHAGYKDEEEEDLVSQEEQVKEGYLKFPSGLIKFEDMIYMLNTSPQDFTYIDKNDNVAYFSEGKHPVFDRTRTIIGRDVRNCHPPKAKPIVDQLIKDFKAGIKDDETRIVSMGTKVLLIRYFAVRNEENEYIGTLETTEEISAIVDQVNEIRAQQKNK